MKMTKPKSKEKTKNAKSTPCAGVDHSGEDILCIIREIDNLKTALSALYKRKREIEEEQKATRRKAEKATEANKRRVWVQMLQMASKGMSAPEIAKELAVSKNNMASKIESAWRKEFPAHYAANHEKIWKRGLLTALRDSPPLFVSSRNKQYDHPNS